MKNEKKELIIRDQKGFTLIELLVVIVIIGILSTFVISNFTGIRERARDAQRKTDLRQIQTALQLYYSDEGYYPQQNELDDCGDGVSLTGVTSGAAYMKEIPCDPLESRSGTEKPYIYIPGSASTPDSCTNGGVSPPCVLYKLLSCIENENDSEADEMNDDNNCDTQDGVVSFTVRNP